MTVFYDPLVLARGIFPAGRSLAVQRISGSGGPGKDPAGRDPVHCGSGTGQDPDPVCYGGEYGPDLEEVAEYHHLTPEEVVKIHTGGDYLVYMIGFAPGFPYVGGLPPEIATPRKKTPRLVIPAGSVGIAGSQTGAYPLETPGAGS